VPPLDTPSNKIAIPATRQDLLAEIQRGKTLRKTSQATGEASAAGGQTKSAGLSKGPPPIPAGRSGLLAEIQNRNYKLRSVNQEQVAKEKEEAAINKGGGLNSIMAVLARRSAIAAEDSDDGNDKEDWD